MRRFSFQISKYVLQAVLPYFIFTWLLLSVILFVQQASRYSDLLFNTNLPNSLIWQLTIALVPNVIAFTCPVAVLVGVIIGLSRMQGDSEMVALRAAGVGNLQIAIPLIFLGLCLSLFAFFINLKGVPFAAQIVRQVALKAALYKLESPIEPGVFNGEINDFTIFVEKGNIEKGIWENIFIYQEDKSNQQVRLITSREGRIDTSGDNSEIFLKNAAILTFEPTNNNKIVSEKIEDFRLEVKTKRGELIEKLARTRETPEEMGLVELNQFAKTLDGIEKTEALILLQRRIILSITPLIFALLGTALVAKFNRGGRGFGVFLSLVSLVFYYLLTLLGEQLARTEAIGVLTSGLIPLVSSIGLIVWLFISRRFFISRQISFKSFFKPVEKNVSDSKIGTKNTYTDFSTGILDLDLIWNLLKNYLLTFGFLTTIYLIFTAFELWKFAGTIDNGIQLLSKYLLFLIPFIYIELAPTALMIATLTTYVIKSRQNEIVTWTAAGLSIYRLLLPCFILMIFIGGLNFGLQELALSETNRIQDSIRDRIRSRNALVNRQGKVWLASGDKIFEFEKTSASDNNKVQNLVVYEFGKDSRELTSVLRADEALWQNKKIKLNGKSEKIKLKGGEVKVETQKEFEITENENPFEESITKPSHLNIQETKVKINNSESVLEKRTYAISLQKKYSTPFIPFIIILFTTPFALSIGRKGNVITIGYAVAVWLLFMGVTNTFGQLGQSGYLSPQMAVWSPLVLFSLIGLYLLTKVKT